MIDLPELLRLHETTTSDRAADEIESLRARVAELEAATRSFISTVLTVKRENQPEWMEYLAERISEVCQVIGDEDRFTYYPSHEEDHAWTPRRIP